MDNDAFWLAIAFFLVIEGLFPFISPAGWRKAISQILQLADGQIRFFAMLSILAGLFMIWWLGP